MLFLPLSFIFWRGIIWTPEMRGKGVQKMFFWLFFWAVLGFQSGLQKIGSNFLQFLGSILDSYFLGSWILWVPFGSHLGPLEAFLRSLCSQKPLKNLGVFKGFWKWRFLTLWSSWWSSWVHLGPLGPLWSQTGFQHEFQHLSTKFLTNCVNIV